MTEERGNDSEPRKLYNMHSIRCPLYDLGVIFAYDDIVSKIATGKYEFNTLE